jgi:hypothetical protein
VLISFAINVLFLSGHFFEFGFWVKPKLSVRKYVLGCINYVEVATLDKDTASRSLRLLKRNFPNGIQTIIIVYFAIILCEHCGLNLF